MIRIVQGGGTSLFEAVINAKNDNLFKIEPTIENTLLVFADKIIKEEIQNENNIVLFNTKSIGVIVFSTDVNAKEFIIDSPIKNWLKQKYLTLKNRLFLTKILDKIRKKHHIYYWTIGKYLTGVYTGNNGKTFTENSVSINIISDTLEFKDILKLAKDICNEFNQESVLVKDIKNNQTYYVF